MIVLLTAIGCSNTEEYHQENNLKQLEFRSNTYPYVVVDGDFLKFDDFQSLKIHLYKIHDDEDDAQTREEYYDILGIDRTTGQFYTQHPASELFDRALGFESLRSIEEDDLIAKANNGEDVFSIVSKATLKSVLNEDGAVKVKERIYVLLTNGLWAIVANNDLTAYNQLINSQIEDIPKDGLNVRIVQSTSQEDFLKPPQGSEIPDEIWVKDWRTSQEYSHDSLYRLTNLSFVEYADGSVPEYEWHYPNGTTSSGILPSNAWPIGSQLKLITRPIIGPGGVGGTGGLDSIKIELRYCIVVPSFGLRMVDDCHAYFDFSYTEPKRPYLNCGIPDFGEWTYAINGGQAIVMPDRITPILGPVDCQLSTTTTVTICVKYERNDICDTYNYECCGTMTLPACEDCNETGETTDTEILPTFNNGETWRIEGLVWVETSGAMDFATPEEVGTRMIVKRRKSNGRWESACFELGESWCEGQYYDKDENCAVYTINENNTRTDCDDNQQINVDHNGARMCQDEVWGRWCITVDGHKQCYVGQNGDGKLLIE